MITISIVIIDDATVKFKRFKATISRFLGVEELYNFNVKRSCRDKILISVIAIALKIIVNSVVVRQKNNQFLIIPENVLYVSISNISLIRYEYVLIGNGFL